MIQVVSRICKRESDLKRTEMNESYYLAVTTSINYM